MIFTTDNKLRDWGQVLHDRDLAGVVLDRVLERGEPKRDTATPHADRRPGGGPAFNLAYGTGGLPHF